MKQENGTFYSIERRRNAQGPVIAWAKALAKAGRALRLAWVAAECAHLKRAD